MRKSPALRDEVSVGFEVVLILLFGATLVVAPILAVIALVRVHQLEKKVRELSKRLDGTGPRPSPTPVAASPGPAPTKPAPPPVQAPPPQPPPKTAAPIDLESIIAGRWLNRIGIVALLLAVGFFLKYAFDNDWIGPAGRVAAGLVCGSALLVYSQWLLGRGYTYFSEGIAATGAGSLYLSLYAAWGFYELVPQGAAFGGMIVVTLAIVALAVGRDSQRLALLALAGGLMTPGVLSAGEDQQIVLLTYLAVLDGGLLVLARARSWRFLEPVGLVGTIFYFAGWYDAHYEASKLVRTLLYGILFFAEFATLPLLRARRDRSLLPEQYATALANVTWFLIALHAMLYRSHRWGLTVAVLLLAAAHLAVVRAIPAAQERPRSKAVRILYAGLALTFVTIAIPIRLEGEWITIAWAVEGAVLVWSGFRSRTRLMRACGLVLFVIVLLSLLVEEIEAPRFLLNARFGTFLVAIVAFALAVFLARSHRELLRPDEGPVFGAVAVAVNLLAVWALSMEVWDFCDRAQLGLDRSLAQQMGLSVLWTLYATVLIVTGVRRHSRALRWQGLTLLAVAVVKVFVFDLSFLVRAYRILSFFALGLLLLIVSFLYQRKLFGDPSR